MKKKRGFTLIELVVVIAILGILAAIAILRISDSMASARGAKIVADLRTLDSAINVRLTATGANLTNLDDLAASEIAAVPTPPEGDFTVTTLSGTSKDYSADDYSATTYTLDETNQRALFSGHPVEFYLAGDTTAANFSDYAQIIAQEIKSVLGKAKNIDSSAPNSTRVNNINTYLTEQGIKLASLGANSWYYDANGKGLLYFSSTDLATKSTGDKVATICYDPNSGNYTVYTATVTDMHNKDVNNDQHYNVLRGFSAYTPSTGSSANGNQTYDAALAYYNTLANSLK